MFHPRDVLCGSGSDLGLAHPALGPTCSRALAWGQRGFPRLHRGQVSVAAPWPQEQAEDATLLVRCVKPLGKAGRSRGGHGRDRPGWKGEKRVQSPSEHPQDGGKALRMFQLFVCQNGVGGVAQLAPSLGLQDPPPLLLL